MSGFPLELEVGFSPETEKNIESWRSAAKGVVSGSQFKNTIRLAVNAALKSASVKAKRLALKGYAVDKETLEKAARPHFAKSGSLTATLEFRGGRIPAVKFKPPKQTEAGVSVQFKNPGGGTVVGAFMGKPWASRGQRNVGVYRRKHRGKGSGKLGLPGQHGRFPLLAITGPAVVSMVGHKEEAAEIQARAREILDKRIDHEMKRLMNT